MVTLIASTNNQQLSENISETQKLRLLFYGGAIEDSHNNTFLNAAKNVRNDYKDFNIIMYKIEDAEHIVKIINEQKNNSIESIDFFSHGGITALYIKNSFFGCNQSLYMSDEIKKEHGRFCSYNADLSEIDYNKFTISAKIEFHGCHNASEELTYGNKNFASIFSEYLYKAGKTKAVVIGHVTKANPDRHKTLKGDDYRHGGRRVYHNGKQLYFTRQEGRILESEINKYFKKYENNQ